MAAVFLLLTSSVYTICKAQSTFYESFNLQNDFTASNHTFKVRSTIDSSYDEQLNISFSFINGRCWNPTLALSFEEIDFDSSNEYFKIYFKSPRVASHMIANCTGNYQRHCGVYTPCITDYNFGAESNIQFFEDGQTATLYAIKSAAVNAFCDGYSLSLNITIACNSERYHMWHESDDVHLQRGLYGHVAAYYGSQLTIIGGIDSAFDGIASNKIYTREITPYDNHNASANELRFKSPSSWNTNTMRLPTAYTDTGLVCDGQCYTQIEDMLYIFGAHNLRDSGRGILLKYDLNSKGQQPLIASESKLELNGVCVAHNVSHLFIIGGYNGISMIPFHNIQSYNIQSNVWVNAFSLLIEPRIHCGCAQLNNKLYSIGGWTIYDKMATNSIEVLELNTRSAYPLNAVLDVARIGHKVISDKKGRLWTIGGRNLNNVNIMNVEILDTINGVMVSSLIPVKYASTLWNGADYSAPWYDIQQNIMFTSGGYDGVSVKDSVQYLAVDRIGTDAFPTPPPTLPPVPTPYPTPRGHYVGNDIDFDMSPYGSHDSVSFTQTIQSSDDLGIDSFFYVDFKFVNGICWNASLSFTFEEVDFASQTNEFIDVFYPIYPVNNIAHCTGTRDFNCGTWIKCMDRVPLDAPALDVSDNSYNYHISVIKSAEVNTLCTYSIQANVTIHCGPRPPPTPQPTTQPSISPTTMAPTSLYTNISHAFDLKGYTANDTVSFIIPVQTMDDYHRDSLYLVQFDFMNGLCHHPSLTFTFEETDFASQMEFIEIYDGSYDGTYLTRCSGTRDRNCDHFIECLSQYPLSNTATDSVKLTLLKSADVGNNMCTYSLNANVTITCGASVRTSVTTSKPSDQFITQTFDLSPYSVNDSISFMMPIQSDIDNGFDVLFHVQMRFTNGECRNPMLGFDFEEIDFQQDYEFIGLYSPQYPRDFIAQCTGSNDYNCGHSVHCIDHYLVSENATDLLNIYLLKSADINKYCNNRSMNANLTISCGPPTPTPLPTSSPTLKPTPSPTAPQFAFHKTVDLSDMDASKVLNSYDMTVQSVVDNGDDVIFNVTFEFINGVCHSPYLSVVFEEIDHASDDEYLEIRYPSDAMYDRIARCDGDDDYNCGHFEHCMSYYDLNAHNVSRIEDEITLYILKSAQVNKLCNYSINANITITCLNANMVHNNVSCPPIEPCTPSQSTVPSIPISPSQSIVNCAGNHDDDDNSDSGHSGSDVYNDLPWILFGVSAFCNLLLAIAWIQERRLRKSVQMGQRTSLMSDSTQMVTMRTRAGHSDLQEIISDASVDYVNLTQ